jgi:DNA-binding CsgD family transcriptional regulator
VPSPSATRGDGTARAAVASAAGSHGRVDAGVSPGPVATPRFTGREAELAALTWALGVPGSVVLVEGELGIGKSRLVSEYLAATAASVTRPVVAYCPPFRQPQTLGPVADALRPAVADIERLGLSGLAGTLRPLFPEWAEVLPAPPDPAEDATAARSRLFRALAELLGRLGTGLVVVEDAHWADEATLEFLLFLASRSPATGPAPGLLVTVRPEDIPAGSLLPRLARLASGDRGIRLALGPLSRAGTAALVSSMLAAEVTEEFAAFLHERAGGVPLAVEESVRLLAGRSDLTRRDGRWVRRRLPKLAVPPTIRDSVQERSARLTRAAQQVLSAAAVLAEPAREDVIGVVAGLDADRARTGLSEALGCALLAEGERGLVSFRHALGCRAVYETMPGPARRLLHQRAGDALEARGAPAATLARHFREAGDTQRWLDHGERAADLALSVGDQATAATLLCELVTVAGLDAEEIARLMDKVVLLALPEESQLRDLAAQLRGVLGADGLAPGKAAVLHFQLGRLLLTMHEVEESQAELEEAMRGLPPGSLQAERAMMLLGWPQGSSRTAREHLRWLRRAGVAAADIPPVERLRLLIDRCTALLLLGEESGWAEAAGIAWQPAAPGERLQVTRAHANLGEVAMLWGRYAEARRRLEHAAQLAHRYECAHLQETVTVTLAHLDWFTGAWPGLAERAAALIADDRLPAAAKQEAILVGGLVASAVGDRDRAGELLAQFAGEALRRDDVQYLMESAAVLAWMHLRAGEVAEALQVTQGPIEMAVGKGTWLWAAELAPARVAALTAAAMTDDAAALVEALARGLHSRDAPAPRANVAVCRALLAESRGEHARAGVLFGRAADAWRALPRPYDALLAGEQQAQSLLGDGQRETGLKLLSETADRLRRLGALGDATRAEKTLAELGVGPRDRETLSTPEAGVPARPARGRPSYGDALSPREREVVRLVAGGQTNREIAQALVVSRQTVAGHLQSAMRKLHVTSRTALAVAAVEAGLL